MSTSADVYHPEWLELEKGLGSRPQLTANPDIDIPVYNGMSEQLAAGWPSELSADLVSLDETISATDKTPTIPVRIYTPRDKGNDLPLIVFFHGGGYIAGNLRSEEAHCRIIAARTPAVVVNVEYPLGPTHTLDQIISSGIVAVNWAASHSPPLTNSSALLVGGGSAGASLAIQLTYAQTQDSSIYSRPITGLFTIFPFCSPAEPAYSGPHSEKHTSYTDKATSAPILTRDVMLTFVKPTDPYKLAIDATSPRHYPLLASKLSDFPRTYIVTAEHDPCRDDGRVLGMRLKEESTSGVKEDYFEGLPHYFHWFPNLKVTGECMDKVVTGVQWVVGGVA